MRKIFTASMIFFLYAAASLRGQIIVQNVNTENFPAVKVKFFAFGQNGKLATNLTRSDFSLDENNVIRPVSSLVNANPSGIAISSVITLDATMSGETKKIADSVASVIVEKILSLVNSECAVTSFSRQNFLHQEFSSNKEKILSSFAAVLPQSATKFKSAFLDKPAGAFEILKKAKNKKTVFLICDGEDHGELSQILGQAVAENISLYLIGIQHVFSKGIRNLALETGGIALDSIVDMAGAKTAAQSITANALGQKPAEITWQSEAECASDKNVKLTLGKFSLENFFSFTAPKNIRTAVIAEPKTGINLLDIVAGRSRDTTITLTAIGGTVNIKDVRASNPFFQVLSPIPPFEIQERKPVEVRVRYNPLNERQNFTEILVESDACSISSTFITAGFSEVGASDSLMIVSPNGGENLRSGESFKIRWRGVLPQDTVILQYSTDGGKSWALIGETTGLEYSWIIPEISSGNCKIRAIQQTGRIITLDHPAVVDMVRISPDGRKILSSCLDSKVRLWDATNGDLIAIIDSSKETRSIGIFSHDGSMIASAGDSGASRVFIRKTDNLNELVKKFSISVYSGFRNQLAFSPDDSLLAIAYNGIGPLGMRFEVHYTYGGLSKPFYFTAGSDLIMQMLKFSSNGKKIISINSHQSGLYSLYSWDMSNVWSSGSGKWKPLISNKIYGFDPDPRGGAVLLTYNGSLNLHDDSTGLLLHKEYGRSYYACTFNPDGSKIFAGSYAKQREVNGVSETYATVDIFDRDEGGLLRSLREHKAEILDLAVSANGKFLASASADRTVKVWDLREPQDDESDAEFSVNTPLAALQDFDFGNVRVGYPLDQATSVLCNSGKISFNIDSAKFTSNIFSVISASGLETQPGQCAKVHLQFNPASATEYADSLRIYSGAEIFSVAVRGSGVLPEFSAPQFIDFGRVRVLQPKALNNISVLRNISSIPLTVLKPELTGNMQFSISSATNYPVVIQPGEEIFLRAQFLPTESDRSMALIKIIIADGDTLGIPLYGEGICGPADETALINISLGGKLLPVKTGEKISLKVSASAPGTLLEELPGAFAFNVSFNKSVLFPEDGFPDTIEQNQRIVRVSGVRPVNDSVLTVLNFTTALGDTEKFSIRISDFSWDECSPNIALDSMEVVFKDVCRTNGVLRRFIDSPEPEISLLPNPSSADATLKYMLIEPGATEIFISDILGQKILEIHKENAAPGLYSEYLDLHTLSSGLYYIVLRTPTQTISRRIERTK